MQRDSAFPRPWGCRNRRSNSDAYVGSAQRGRVVDSVTHHHDGAPRSLFGAHNFQLLGRQHLRDDLIHAQHLSDFVRRGLPVPGQQDKSIDAERAHRFQCCARIGARLVAQHEATEAARAMSYPHMRYVAVVLDRNGNAEIVQESSAAKDSP